MVDYGIWPHAGTSYLQVYPLAMFSIYRCVSIYDAFIRNVEIITGLAIMM